MKEEEIRPESLRIECPMLVGNYMGGLLHLV
jgi:hypothetical protein